MYAAMFGSTGTYPTWNDAPDTTRQWWLNIAEAAEATTTGIWPEIPVLGGQGFVRLDAVLANDIDVVNAARVSMNKRVDVMGPADKGLIGFLMGEAHGSPFEHSYFRFHVQAPLSVAREAIRHRIGVSWNEMSGRYTEIPELYHVPTEMRSQVGKPGRYRFETIRDLDVFDAATEEFEAAGREAFARYHRLLKLGIAKEQAREVLVLSTMTQWIWSFNARSLMNMLHLRNAPNALKEFREYAEVIEQIFREEMPLTAAFFVDNGRVAP